MYSPVSTITWLLLFWFEAGALGRCIYSSRDTWVANTAPLVGDSVIIQSTIHISGPLAIARLHIQAGGVFSVTAGASVHLSSSSEYPCGVTAPPGAPTLSLNWGDEKNYDHTTNYTLSFSCGGGWRDSPGSAAAHSLIFQLDEYPPVVVVPVAPQFLVHWIQPSVHHVLVLWAVSAAGRSPPSQQLVFTPPLAPPEFFNWTQLPPSRVAPSVLAADAVGLVVLKWEKPPPGTGHLVYDLLLFVDVSGEGVSEATRALINCSEWRRRDGEPESRVPSDPTDTALLASLGCWIPPKRAVNGVDVTLDIIMGLISEPTYYFAVRGAYAPLSSNSTWGPLSGFTHGILPFALPPQLPEGGTPVLLHPSASGVLLQVLPFGNGGAPILRFQFQYTSGAEGVVVVWAPPPAPDPTNGRLLLELSGLSPATVYRGRLTASNVRGRSLQGLDVQWTTLPSIPAPPTLVTVRPSGVGELTLTWVPGATNGLSIQAVRLLVCFSFSSSSSSCYNHSAGTSTTTIILSDLRSATQYHITVFLSNTLGESAQGVGAEATTPHSRPRGLSVNATALGPLRVHFFIFPPSDYGDGSVSGFGMDAYVAYTTTTTTTPTPTNYTCVKCPLSVTCEVKGEGAKLRPEAPLFYYGVLSTPTFRTEDCGHPDTPVSTLQLPPNTPPHPFRNASLVFTTATTSSLHWTPNYDDYGAAGFNYTLHVEGCRQWGGVQNSIRSATNWAVLTNLTADCEYRVVVEVEGWSGIVGAVLEWKTGPVEPPEAPQVLLPISQLGPTHALLYWVFPVFRGGAPWSALGRTRLDVWSGREEEEAKILLQKVLVDPPGATGTHLIGLNASSVYQVRLSVAFVGETWGPWSDWGATFTTLPPGPSPRFTSVTPSPCTCGGCRRLHLGLPSDSGGAPITAVQVSNTDRGGTQIKPFISQNRSHGVIELSGLYESDGTYALLLRPVTVLLGVGREYNLSNSGGLTPPCAPTELRVVVASATRLTLGFTGPTQTGGLPWTGVVVSGQGITYYEYQKGTNEEEEEEEGEKVVLRGLEPNHIYTLILALVNALGVGAASPPFYVTTPPPTLPSCVRNLSTAPAVGGRLTLVFYEPLEPGCGSAERPSLPFTFWINNEKEEEEKEKKDEEIEKRFMEEVGVWQFTRTLETRGKGRRLRAGERVSVKVATAGCIPLEVVQGVTGPPSPPLPPLFGPIAVSRHALRLQWTPHPDDGGCPITNYTVNGDRLVVTTPSVSLNAPEKPVELRVVSQSACGLRSLPNSTTVSVFLPPCPAGWEEPEDHWAPCTTCLEGTVAAFGAACTPVPPGYFSPSKGGVLPLDCPPGAFTSVRGATACSLCPSGRYAPTPRASACTPCPPNYYSFHGATGCVPCPRGASCASGLLLIPQGVWWRFPEEEEETIIDNTTVFYECASRLRCQVGDGQEGVLLQTAEEAANLTFRCAPGTRGALCGSCAPGYAATGAGDGGCFACPALNGIGALYAVLTILVALGIAVVLIRRAMRPAVSLTPVVARITIDYIQALAATGEFIERGTPSIAAFQEFAALIGGFGTDSAPLRCLNNAPFVTTFSATMLLPPAVGLVVLGALLTRQVTPPKASTILVVSLFLLYNTLVRTVALAFSCTSEAIRGYHYLLADMSLRCEEEWGLRVGAGIAGGLYVLGIPCIGAVLVWRAKGSLDTEDTKARLGFIYAGFRPSAAIFEAVVMARKAALALIAVFFSHANSQLLAGVVLVTLSICLQLHTAPFSSPLLNALEACALGAVLTLQFGLLTLRFGGAPALVSMFTIGCASLVFGALLWGGLRVSEVRKLLEGPGRCKRKKREAVVVEEYGFVAINPLHWNRRKGGDHKK